MAEKKKADKVKDLLNDVKDSTKDYTKKEMEDGKIMALLSYIIPPVPYFAEKNNKFVKFHAKQGMNLFVVAIAYAVLRWVLSSLYAAIHCGGGWEGEWCRAIIGGWYLPWYLNIPMVIIAVAISIACLLGIYYSCTGKAKEIPLLNKLKLFK